jgi:hypothetical protein
LGLLVYYSWCNRRFDFTWSYPSVKLNFLFIDESWSLRFWNRAVHHVVHVQKLSKYFTSTMFLMVKLLIKLMEIRIMTFFLVWFQAPFNIWNFSHPIMQSASHSPLLWTSITCTLIEGKKVTIFSDFNIEKIKLFS